MMISVQPSLFVGLGVFFWCYVLFVSIRALGATDGVVQILAATCLMSVVVALIGFSRAIRRYGFRGIPGATEDLWMALAGAGVAGSYFAAADGVLDIALAFMWTMGTGALLVRSRGGWPRLRELLVALRRCALRPRAMDALFWACVLVTSVSAIVATAGVARIIAAACLVSCGLLLAGYRRTIRLSERADLMVGDEGAWMAGAAAAITVAHGVRADELLYLALACLWALVACVFIVSSLRMRATAVAGRGR